jgi:hypothetical protein
MYLPHKIGEVFNRLKFLPSNIIFCVTKVGRLLLLVTGILSLFIFVGSILLPIFTLLAVSS